MKIMKITSILLIVTGLTTTWSETAYIYLGCFRDVSNDKDKSLNDDGRYVPNKLNIDLCFEWCSEMDHAYFGVASTMCFCGSWSSHYAKHGHLSESECGSPCPGNITQKCGSINAIRVFRDVTTLCPTIQPIANGDVDQNGVRATFRCHLGYRLDGTESQTCGYHYSERQFVWPENVPECKIIDTSETPRPPTKKMIVTKPTTVPKVSQTTSRSTTKPQTIPPTIGHASTKRLEGTSTTMKKSTTISDASRKTYSSKPKSAETEPSTAGTNKDTKSDSQHDLIENGATSLLSSAVYSILISLSSVIMVFQ